MDWYTRGVWYSLVGRGTVVRLDYQLWSDFGNGDSELSIFTGSCDDLVCVTNVQGADHPAFYASDYNNELAWYEFIAEQDKTFWFLLTGERFTAAADYEFTVSEYDIPGNDNCEDATVISTSSLSYKSKAGWRPRQYGKPLGLRRASISLSGVGLPPQASVCPSGVGL